MVLVGIWNKSLWGQLVLFLISNIIQLNPLYVEAGSMKYSNVPLVTALSARAQDYAVTNVAPSSPGLIGTDSTHSGLMTAVNSATQDVEAASILDSPTNAGGEIIVPKTFSLNGQEPTCEQLRAMWIFSKRQSRAAEVTNEIPTYRDPFAYNVWEPFYSSSRSFGGRASLLPRHSDRSRPPVFGRVINREPIVPQRVGVGHRQRLYGVEGSRYGSMSPSIYGSEAKTSSSYTGGASGSRRPSKYRHVGSHSSADAGVTGGNQNSVNIQGSFQRLKALIWTERAKELTLQRKAEEMAARAAVLKEIANGQNIQSFYKSSKSESPMMDENRSPDRNLHQRLNDDRMPIATGQSHYIENNYNSKKNSHLYLSNAKNGKKYIKGSGKTGDSIGEEKKIGISSSLHSYRTTNKNQNYKGVDKLKSFSPFAKEGTGTTTVPSSGKYMFEEHNMDIPRTYPIRRSHFRERNHVLLRKDAPLERSSDQAFSRNIRSQSKQHLQREDLMQTIIEYLNRYTFPPAGGKEHVENYMKIANDVFVENLFPREHDPYTLPSIGNAVYKPYMKKGNERYAEYEQPMEIKKDWDDVNTMDAKSLVRYVNPQISYPETSDIADFYEYENY